MPNIIGQIFLNQFRVDSFVASGGMGAVYRVWDLKRNVPLAMKVLHSDLADDPAIFKRFQREANALKKLAHPNIVPLYGLYQTLDVAFLLERFIDGPSLGEILRKQKGKPLSINEALVYLKALCAALGYAHSNGVVHCDVKPGNVMIDRGGTIYLTDFGIARHAESTTTTMGTAGTPAYMAPEQICGNTVSPVTDVYALGVLLFEMLTGQRPFRGNEAGTEKGGTTANERIRYGQLNLAPPDPRSLNPKLPDGLAQAMLKALAKNPQERYSSTQDFFNAIRLEAGGRAGNVGDRVTLASVFVEEVASIEHENIQDKQPVSGNVPTSRRRSPWLIIGGVVVCMLVIGGIVQLSGQFRSQPTAAPAGLMPAVPTQTTLASPTDTFFFTNTQPSISTQQSSWEQGQIVYIVRNESNLHDITMQEMTANAVSHLLLASSNAQQLYGPYLSADSSEVVYYDNSGGNNGILDVQTLAIQEIAACNSPSFSTDKNQIICGGGSRFKILDSSGNQVSSLDVGQDGWLPVESPDGSEIAFAVKNNGSTSIWKISSSGGKAIPLASDAYENYGPSWSSDGQWIAYQAGDGTGVDDIWIMDRNGGNKKQITRITDKFSRAPVWSPDGMWLAFVSNRDNSAGPDYGDVYVVSLNSLKITQVTHTNGRVLDWRISWR